MHNFKFTVKIILVAVVFAALIGVLDLALYPCTFTRNDIHAVSSGKIDDLIIGTSHGKMNIDPDTLEEITGHSGHNAAVGGEYGIDAYYITKLAIEKGDIKRVIYEVSPGYFLQEKEEGNNYLLFYHEFPLSVTKLQYFWDAIVKKNFRTSLFPWYEYSLSYELKHVAENWRKKTTGDYSIEDLKTDTQEYHANGFIENYPVAQDDMVWSEPTLYEEGAIVDVNMEYLKKTIELCKSHGVEFVAVVTPMPDTMLNMYPDNYTAAWNFFDSFFTENDVTYFDFNSDYYSAFSHTMDIFTDYDGHMNGDSARAFSSVLAKLIMGEEIDTVEPTAAAAPAAEEAAG